MIPVYNFLFKTLIKSFYRENAGVFVFFFVVLFGIIHNDPMDYHYSLISGMLDNNLFFSIVLLAWLLYARKCIAYVTMKIKSPSHDCLQVLTLMNNRKLSIYLMFVAVGLYLPLLLYSTFIIGVAFEQHKYAYALIVAGFYMLISYMAVTMFRHQLFDRDKEYHLTHRFRIASLSRNSYLNFLLGYMFSENKMLITGIKVFTCGILYLMAVNNDANDYDVQMPFLFFTFGIFANSIVIQRLRSFEEKYISFYRGLPVRLIKRFSTYLLLYLIYFIPEMVTICRLTPLHLHKWDAFYYLTCGYCILLLLNSTSFISFFKMKVYLRIAILMYAIVYMFVLAGSFNLLLIFLFLLSALLFFVCYYQYEHSE